MSASLVGSEMCIRDSPSRIRAELDRCVPFRARLSCTRAARPRWLREAVPVSYTHLTLPTICSV
eukprot:1137901-Alexandrium_andersonii.AAC.1